MFGVVSIPVALPRSDRSLAFQAEVATQWQKQPVTGNAHGIMTYASQRPEGAKALRLYETEFPRWLNPSKPPPPQTLTAPANSEIRNPSSPRRLNPSKPPPPSNPNRASQFRVPSSDFPSVAELVEATTPTFSVLYAKITHKCEKNRTKKWLFP